MTLSVPGQGMTRTLPAGTAKWPSGQTADATRRRCWPCGARRRSADHLLHLHAALANISALQSLCRGLPHTAQHRNLSRLRCYNPGV